MTDSNEGQGKPFGPPSEPAPGAGGVAAGPLTAEEKTWGMVCHLAGLAGFTGIPFGNILGPLIVWLIKKDTSAFVDANGKEAINFHITMSIIAVVIAPSILLFGIGFLLLGALIIVGLVFLVMAAVKANEGIAYKYPVCFRFIK